MKATILSRRMVLALTAFAAVTIAAGVLMLRSDHGSGPAVDQAVSGESPLPTATQALLAEDGPRPTDGSPYRTYYFEARVTWGSTSQGSDRVAQIWRGWYEAPSRTRWDISSADPRYKDVVRTIILTEKESIYYEPADNAYMRQPVPPGQAFDKPMPVMSNVAIGPYVVSYLSETKAKPTAVEQVLGRKTDKYEEKTCGGGSSASTNSLGTVTTSTRQNDYGLMRFWVDKDRQFVMKQTRDSCDPFIAEITKVVFDQPIPPSVFTLAPPAGARRVPASMVFKAPFLSPDYIPDDIVSTGQGQAFGGSVSDERYLTLDSGKLSIKQEKVATKDTLPAGSPVQVNGTSGTTATSGGITSIVWQVKDILITVSGPLPFDELLKIAESMH